ncbi:MAG: Na(+)-translocating NADH-quinone reductase subunit A [Paracoccaceae bacterium]|nr:Na(+)-translocating NADH-quinone reductase subunit A [Paracoccaceae bacterium]
MRFGRGLDIEVGGRPRQEIGAVEVPLVVGLLGSDYPGLRLKPLVEPGAAVRVGEPVMEDRAHPALCVTAPVSGVVEEVSIGPKRRISALTIRREDGTPRRFALPGANPSRSEAEALLLDSGLWMAFLARPFGRVPLPGTAPDAIFLTALDTEPGATDPVPVVTAAAEPFRRGAAFLSHLTDGPVFVCQGPGPALAEPGPRLRVETFAGPHPAGLPGTHIDRLFPIGHGRTVWQIGAQEVIAIGTLLATGELPGERVVALGGPLARDPRLVRLPLGADIETMAARESRPGRRRVLSGSALSGGESRFLRRRHTQIALLPRAEAARPRRWLASALLKRPPLLPHAALERALGPGLPAIPLLRALSLGDAAGAARLGATALLEEDLALASYLSGGTEDFGARLRAVLDALEEEA